MNKALKRYNLYLIVFLALASLSVIQPAQAQVNINVTASTPCFLNYTAAYKMLENCNADGDTISWITSGWTWVTGGFFPMIIVSLIIGAVYIKYQEAVYPIYIGIVFLPISYMFFPPVFLSWAIIMAFVGIGIMIWYALLRQTQ